MRSLPDTCSKQAINYNTAASGGDCVLTLNAVANNYNVLDWIVWSYAADPTSGEVKVVDTTNNTTLLSMDVTVGGPGQIVFGDRGLVAPKGAALEITMVDGNTTKKLSVQSR